MKQQSKIISGEIYIEGKLWAKLSPAKCELFNFCNCKTAMCRVSGPDESCYWYRYFKKLIEESERKI